MSVFLLDDGEVLSLRVETREPPPSPAFMNAPLLGYRGVCFCGRSCNWECRDCGYVLPRFRGRYAFVRRIDPDSYQRDAWLLGG